MNFKRKNFPKQKNSSFSITLGDQSGYISDGPTQKYSLYKKSLSTNLDKNKSSSAKGLKSIFGKIIRTNSGHFREENEQQTSSTFQRGGLRATINNGKSSLKQLR